MLNQSSGMRVSDNLDTSFNTLVNMTDTNITAVDYKKRKAAIKNMLEKGNTIGTFLIMGGEKAYEDFIPDQVFIDEFKEKYYSFDEGGDEEDE